MKPGEDDDDRYVAPIPFPAAANNNTDGTGGTFSPEINSGSSTTPAPFAAPTRASELSRWEETGFTPVTLSILCGLVFLLFILVGLIGWQLWRQQNYRRRLVALAEAHSANHWNASSSPQQYMEERIRRRYETIEHWLITKKVQPHDPAFCHRVIHELIPSYLSEEATEGNEKGKDGNGDDDDNNKAGELPKRTNTNTLFPSDSEIPPHRLINPKIIRANNNDSLTNCTAGCFHPHAASAASTNAPPLCDGGEDLWHADNGSTPECPICMSPFEVHDIVSWSANNLIAVTDTPCKHVYHHECIKEWLLRRTQCPYCRQIFLPCDTITTTTENPLSPAMTQQQQLTHVSNGYAAATSRMYFCLHDGLITLPPLIRCTATELDKLRHCIFNSMLRPDQLKERRGERAEGTLATLQKEFGGDDEEIQELQEQEVLPASEDVSENPHWNTLDDDERDDADDADDENDQEDGNDKADKADDKNGRDEKTDTQACVVNEEVEMGLEGEVVEISRVDDEEIGNGNDTDVELGISSMAADQESSSTSIKDKIDGDKNKSWWEKTTDEIEHY